MRWLAVIALVGLAGTASAQSGPAAVVEGRVTDSTSDAAVAGATVLVKNTTTGTAADADGFYRLERLPAGELTLAFSSVGYASVEVTVDLAANDALNLDISLTPSIETFGQVTIEAAGSLAGGPRGVRDIPGSITVLGPAALERFSDSDVHRVLSDVPGVTVQEEEGYGLRPNIGIRGTISDRSSGITLMEDGVLIAPAPYAAPAAYYFPPTGRMDGVEVRKGSSQIAYGPYTTGGAVNLVSAQTPSQTQARLDIRGGTNNARTVHGRLGTGGVSVGSFKIDALVEGYGDAVDGFKQVARYTDGAPEVIGGDTGYSLWSALGKVRISTTPSTQSYHALELKATLDGQESNETYLGLEADDFDANPAFRYAGSQIDRFESDHGLAHLRYVGMFGTRLDVTVTAYVTRFRRDWFKLDSVSDGQGDDIDTNGDGLPDSDLAVPINTMLEDPTLYADELDVARGDNAGRLEEGVLIPTSNDRSYKARGVETVVGYRPVGSGGLDVLLKGGLRLHFDEVDRLQRADQYGIIDGAMFEIERGVPGNSGNRVDDARAIASYLEAQLETGPLVVTPGVRVEFINQSRSDYGLSDPNREDSPDERDNQTTAFMPGLGIRWDAAAHTTLFGGVHRGFAPGSSQPGVEPETSTNAELGLRTQRGTAASLQTVAFATWYDNLLGADFESSGGTGSGDLFNGGKARTYGFEFSAEADPLAGNEGSLRMPLRLVYTFTDARFQSNFTSSFPPWGIVREGDEIPYVAPHVLTFGAGLEGRWARINARLIWVAETRGSAGQGPIPESDLIDERLVVDLQADLELPLNLRHARIVANLSVRNLADATYVASRRPAGLRPGLPRTVLAGLRLQFR